MFLRKVCCLFFALFAVSIAYSQTPRKVALLNMNTYNNESNNSRYQSALNLLSLTGIAFDTTSVLTTALQYPVVVAGTRIIESSFNTTQKNQIKSYVNGGGILITSYMRDTALYQLFGISASISDDGLYAISWDTTNFPGYFDLVDDSLEQVVSLGDTSETNFFTRIYTPTTAQTIGTYEDGTCAMTMNQSGLGKTYALGPDFRDVILRNQINLDADAQRTYSNGFEPSTDVFVFIIRNIIRSHIPNSVYKYTSPDNTSSVLLITHDIDSRTGADTMGIFSDFEFSRDISAHYNVTTRYVDDDWMSDFYIAPASMAAVDALVAKGHVLASHSVGHFPDFADESVFPYGTLGNTMISYQPYYTSGSGTSGGMVLAELEVSRDLLQTNHGVSIKSFRAGHLCYPDSLGMGLELTGYEFNSTNASGDILTGFPHYAYDRRSFSGAPNSVLEISMTISDVAEANSGFTAANYMNYVSMWAHVSRKYDRNNSPVTLLIHPNRTYKLAAEQRLLDSIPAGMKPYSFESYGRFWRKRDSLLFHTVLNNTGDTLTVRMDNNLLDQRQSFVIDHAGLDTVSFFDESGNALTFQSQAYSATQRLYYQNANTISLNSRQQEHSSFKVYPNPSNGTITLIMEKDLNNAGITITDLTGRPVYKTTFSGSNFQIDLSSFITQSGLLFVQLTTKDKVFTRKIMFVK
jgi:hypothetical protein